MRPPRTCGAGGDPPSGRSLGHTNDGGGGGGQTTGGGGGSWRRGGGSHGPCTVLGAVQWCIGRGGGYPPPLAPRKKRPPPKRPVLRAQRGGGGDARTRTSAGRMGAPSRAAGRWYTTWGWGNAISMPFSGRTTTVTATSAASAPFVSRTPTTRVPGGQGRWAFRNASCCRIARSSEAPTARRHDDHLDGVRALQRPRAAGGGEGGRGGGLQDRPRRGPGALLRGRAAAAALEAAPHDLGDDRLLVQHLLPLHCKVIFLLQEHLHNAAMHRDTGQRARSGRARARVTWVTEAGGRGTTPRRSEVGERRGKQGPHAPGTERAGGTPLGRSQCAGAARGGGLDTAKTSQSKTIGRGSTPPP